MSHNVSIDTLVADVTDVLANGVTPGSLPQESLATYGAAVARHTRDALEQRGVRSRSSPHTIFASEIGDQCATRLWYKRHMPHLALPISGELELKFLMGDFIEETLLYAAEVAGHEVTYRQKEVEIQVTTNYATWDVVGHIDAIIDGVLVDVKSCSNFAFKKYSDDGVISEHNQSFGYTQQMQVYELILNPVGGTAFWIANKETGQHELVRCEATTPAYTTVANALGRQDVLDRAIGEGTYALPPPEYKPVPMGKKGNMKLDTQCKYCGFKKMCFPEVRAFKYSNQIEYLTTVKDTPSVSEIQI